MWLPFFPRFVRVGISFLLISSGGASIASAANCPSGNLYVDFEGGSDLNPGTSTATPWKHSPGDLNATGAAACTLVPGNTVNLKGGVIYRGTITIANSGLAMQEITVTTAMGWGTGKAILDGSTPLSGWSPCTSRNECLQNDRWDGMYFRDLPMPTHIVSPIGLLLFQGDRKLQLAQFPQSTQAWYQNTSNFYSPTQMTKTSLTDPRLAQLGGVSLVGKYFWIWCCGNELSLAKILSYNAATFTVTFASLEPYVYDAPTTRYAIVNAPGSSTFSAAGSYYYDEAAQRIYLLPFDGEDITTTNSIYLSTLSNGIHVPNGVSHVTVANLVIQRQSGDSYGEAGSIAFGDGSHLTARDNTLRYSSGYGAYSLAVLRTQFATIANNHLYDIGGSMQGILYSGTNSSIIGNTLERLSRTNLYVAGGSSVAIIGNTIRDSAGVHGHSFAIYQGATDILMADNIMTNVASAATQDCSNLTMVNNVVENGVTWDNICNNSIIVNNIIGTIGTGYGPLGNPPPPYTAKNNIGMSNLQGASNLSTLQLDNSMHFSHAPRIFFAPILDRAKMPSLANIGECYIEAYTEYTSMIKNGDVLTFSFDNQPRVVQSVTRLLFGGNYRNKVVFSPPVQLLRDGTLTIWPAGTTQFSIDYLPKPQSVFVDSGEDALSVLPLSKWPSYRFGTDIRRVQRPQGTGWDRGVYEFSRESSDRPAAPNNLQLNADH